MKKQLLCNIFRAGTKFIVTDEVKETTFPPGTTAFMAFLRESDMDYQDVVRVRTITIRRGKGGMDRLDSNSMLIPVFSDPRMLKYENYLPIGKRHYVHVEQIPIEEASVMAMDDMDFLGWSCAKVTNLWHLTNNIAKKSAPKLWPKNQNTHPLAVAIKFGEYFNSDKESTINSFAKNIEFRTSLVNEIRYLEAAAVKCDILYQKQVNAAVLNSAKFMLYTNENYFEVVDSEQAKNTIAAHEIKLKWLDKMIINTVQDK